MKDRLQERVFGRLAEAATARPGWTVAAALVLAALSLVFALARIEIKTSNLDLVDPGLPEVARFRDFAQSFGTPNVLVVVLEGNDPAKLRAAVDRTAAEIRGAHGVRAVFGRLPYEPASLFPLAMMGIDPYFTSRDKTLAFLFVQPSDPDSSAETIAPFVKAVRERIAAAHLETDGIHAGLTGLPQYALDDKDIIQRDTSRLSAVSFLLILGLFAVGFSEFSRPLLASATLAASGLFVLGVIAVVPGHLTLVSATFFSALFGLGIDYGTYVVDRFEEHLADGQEKRRALVTAVRELGPGLTTGALTTAFAFYTMMFSGFRGFEELGFIGGTGILIALFLMATLLPALLMLGGGKRRRERPLLERRVGRFLARVQRPGLAAALAVLTLAGLAFGLPRFDGDYLNLQPKDSEAVRLERKMIERSAFSPQFAAFVVDSPEKAKEITEKLRRQDTVGSVRSAADIALLDAVAKPIPGEHDAFLASFQAKDGRLAVYAYPNGNVWDPAFESRFLSQMRAIDPNVTGMPVLGRFMIDLSKHALLVTAALSAVVILLLVLLDLKSPAWSALALLPAVLSVAATLASMRLLGIDFNPLNVMALPVILGTVVDAGAQIVHRFREERRDLGRTLAGSGAAVLLCVLTTIVGFGALMFTTHRGLASFGIVLALGSTWSLLFSLFVLPGLLKLVAARQEKSHASLQALARNHQGLP
ncbi:MAG TPA: MMPL family transporter [Thermoanaerobaculia bacterium]|nr:MMPL family transporter [Thermoanaerobaculia bacterium]